MFDPLESSVPSLVSNSTRDDEAGTSVLPIPLLHESGPEKVGPGFPRHLLELIGKACRASHGGLGFVSADGELVNLLTFGLAEDVSIGLWRSPWVVNLLQFLARQPAPINLSDPQHQLAQLGIAAGLPPLGPLLALPLDSTDASRGALYLFRRQGAPAFDEHDEETILPITAWLAKDKLVEDSRLVDRLRVLNTVAQATAGNLDLTRILKVALRELDRHLPMHICAVWLVEGGPVSSSPHASPGEPVNPNQSSAQDEGFLVLADASAVPGEAAGGLGLFPGMRVRLRETSFVDCVHQGQALYTELGRAEECGNALSQELACRGATCTFAVPLRAGDGTLGILQCVCLRPSGFTSEQIQLLYLVADLVGPAISNCQLFRRLSTAYEDLRVAQNQLIQAEKMRALGELAGGMAHEFNNSLCGVLGFIELVLLHEELAPSLRAYLQSARTCAFDAAHTVRRVQDFARWQRNEQTNEILDINDLVRQTVELIRHKWESLEHARGTPVVVEVRTEAQACVSGNAAELREVLTNLAFNAVDAMPQGGTLTIRCGSTAGEVLLAVQDTGVGISAADRQRLFEPFFSTKGEHGNGLGLSVTFGIVRRHGGSITVESEVGRGATFTVRLPAAQTNAIVESAGAPAVPAPAGRSLRVLVVDDEESIRRFLAAGLIQLGHRPHVTSEASEALDAFAAEAFDVVLTDLGLPGLSGEEVARAVVERSPGTPVLLLTGWADQLNAQRQSLEGVTRILSKPISLDTLATALASIS